MEDTHNQLMILDVVELVELIFMDRTDPEDLEPLDHATEGERKLFHFL